MFYATGYLACLVLMCFAVVALFNGAIGAIGFIVCILYGTAIGCYFVYRDYMGK
jgi:hypothetical protein